MTGIILRIISNIKLDTMTQPGSIFIDNIDYTRLNYLVNGSVTSSMTNSNFNLVTGKPKNNISMSNKVDAFFMDTLANNLFENVNINEKLIYNYPKLLEVDALRDIHILDESTIDIVFIYEGASMKNMFGYYMYDIDDTGVKRILGNADMTGGYYYNPTVIFPHVYSDDTDVASLKTGETRRLIGNLPNGNFCNIYIGLFLVPHGWYAYEQNSLIDNRAIVHSTIEFNTSFVQSDYETMNSKIYSIYFKTKSQGGNEILLAAFEDIIISSNTDLDYNDCVVGFDISDVTHIEDWEKYDTIHVDAISNVETNNNIVGIDENGEYVYLDTNRDVPTGRNYIFERHMFFNNSSDRDTTYTAYNNLLKNYIYRITKEISGSEYKVVCSYLFRNNDIKFSKQDDGSHKIHIFESKYNKHDANTAVNQYKKTLENNLKNVNYHEKYRMYEEGETGEIISLTETFDKPQKDSDKEFRIIGNGIMDCLNGKSHLPANNTQTYMVYKNMSGNNGVIINITMAAHPTGYMGSTKKFVRYVTFIANNTESIIIDLGTLNVYKLLAGNLVSNEGASYTNIDVSDKIYTSGNIKNIINIFRSDSGAYYRTVTLNDTMKFYCIRIPNVKNNPTMVLLDAASYIEWNDKYNTVSGTYYNKHRLYPVDSYTSIVSNNDD